MSGIVRECGIAPQDGKLVNLSCANNIEVKSDKSVQNNNARVPVTSASSANDIVVGKDLSSCNVKLDLGMSSILQPVLSSPLCGDIDEGEQSSLKKIEAWIDDIILNESVNAPVANVDTDDSFDFPDRVFAETGSRVGNENIVRKNTKRRTWIDGVIPDHEFTIVDDEQLDKDVQEEIDDRELANAIIRCSSMSKSAQIEQPIVVSPRLSFKEMETPETIPEEDASQPVRKFSIMESIEKEYSDLVKLKIFQLAGDDLDGRPVIAFSMSQLPPRASIDHSRLFTFMQLLLDQYVENDYTIVYFHSGLNAKNKPPLKMLLEVFTQLDTKYKKNLKALLLVHPTKFIKTVMKVFYPLISKKFGKKIKHISCLDQLKTFVRLDQLDIPKDVFKHDLEFSSTGHDSLERSKIRDSLTRPKQFGVPIKSLIKKSGHDIPIVIQSTIDFITNNALDIEGIFRRSAQTKTIKEAVDTFNAGVNFEFGDEHVFLAPNLLKKFLRDLPEPLLTFELYDKLIESCTLKDKERILYVKKILNEDLAEQNRFILMFLMQFLQHVIAHSLMNKMDSGSLAIVLGPNLLWQKAGSPSLAEMSKINSFTKFMIDNSNLLFEVVENTKTNLFGTRLHVLKEITNQLIPIPVQATVDYITKNALEVDGIFRRSAQTSLIDEAVDFFNLGIAMDFSKYDIHLAPAVLKRFLRDLPEPLLTFELFPRIMEACDMAADQKLPYLEKLLNHELPVENRAVLIYLLDFFRLVTNHSSQNLMTPATLAFVIGPNMIWSRDGDATVKLADKINAFTEFLINNALLLFT